MSDSQHTLGPKLHRLIRPDCLFSASSVLAKPSPVPRAGGIYAWYFREIPPLVPTENCLVQDGFPLLYIGISPSEPPTNGKPPSRQNLNMRIRYHYRGNAEGSTLRLTLGVLLADVLGIQLHRVGSGKRLTFASGERRLTDWMAENALVVWAEDERPWVLEHEAFAALTLPLNLRDNTDNPFRDTLSALRSDAKRRARDGGISVGI